MPLRRVTRRDAGPDLDHDFLATLVDHVADQGRAARREVGAAADDRARPTAPTIGFVTRQSGRMEPDAPSTRPSAMRSLALSAAALLLPLSLAACGSSDDGDDVATDPGPTTATSTPTPSPTAEPTVGTYPEFAPTDYSFELTVTCFCMGAGVPIVVTVADADVVGAVYGMAQGGGRDGDIKPGDRADKIFWLTINDVIEKANDTTAARVDVDWPADQDYPNSVYVDADQQIADDETGYAISKVEVS